MNPDMLNVLRPVNLQKNGRNCSSEVNPMMKFIKHDGLKAEINKHLKENHLSKSAHATGHTGADTTADMNFNSRDLGISMLEP
jgi:hypothetical protein